MTGRERWMNERCGFSSVHPSVRPSVLLLCQRGLGLSLRGCFVLFCLRTRVGFLSIGRIRGGGGGDDDDDDDY